MKKHYKQNFQQWSKCFASLLPLQERRNGEWVQLPRLMNPNGRLPRFVQECATTMSLIPRFRLLDWEAVGQPSPREWFGRRPVPPAAYIGAFLVKIDQKLPSLGHLRRFLTQHPALIWALGFPLFGKTDTRHGFDPEASLPSRQHFSRVLRELDNDQLQAMLTTQVSQLQSLLPDQFGQIISLDTKHILAWVKENNPRQFIKEGRFDKSSQPIGDLDCKLGCKKQHNRIVKTKAKGKQSGDDFTNIKEGEFYWGYASGAVATKMPGWGEFVLAEWTETFDKGDVRHFFPLMAQVERRLGFRPRYAALDAAFDSFYVYEYFYSDAHDGFAAVPLKQPNGQPRRFDENGLPLCSAGLPMPVRKMYNDRTKAIIHHRRAIHACPLLHPEATGERCSVEHKQWKKGGCSANIPVSQGPRLRYQIDRQSEQYKQVYAQRTAVERIFSQAKALGIERPKLRNRQAIANQNTLIYLLVNLRGLGDVLAKIGKHK